MEDSELTDELIDKFYEHLKLNVNNIDKICRIHNKLYDCCIKREELIKNRDQDILFGRIRKSEVIEKYKEISSLENRIRQYRIKKLICERDSTQMYHHLAQASSKAISNFMLERQLNLNEEKFIKISSQIEEVFFCIKHVRKDYEELFGNNTNVTKPYAKQLSLTFAQFHQVNSKYWGLDLDNDTKVYKVRWKDIDFRNGEIIWRTELGFFAYEVNSCLEKYNELKFYIKQFKENHLTFYIRNKEVQKIDGLELLVEIFIQLEIETLFKDKDFETSEIFNELLKYDKGTIQKIYKLYNKSMYFEYLCNIQSDNLKIVPLLECKKNKSTETVLLEEAFLFSVQQGDLIYIFWENVEVSRATHVFRCSADKYINSLQQIFDYISGDQLTNRREKLHKISEFNFSDFTKYLGSVKHKEEFDAWKNKIEAYCSCE